MALGVLPPVGIAAAGCVVVGGGVATHGALQRMSDRHVEAAKASNSKLSKLAHLALASLAQISKECATLVAGVGATLIIPMGVGATIATVSNLLQLSLAAQMAAASMIFPYVAIGAMAAIGASCATRLAAKSISFLSEKGLENENRGPIAAAALRVMRAAAETIRALTHVITLAAFVVPTMIVLPAVWLNPFAMPLLLAATAVGMGYLYYTATSQVQELPLSTG